MNMQFIQSYEVVAYKGRLASFVTQFRNSAVVLEGISFVLWCGSSILQEEKFVQNHDYSAKDTEFDIRFRQQHEQRRPLFLGQQNAELIALPPAFCGEMFVSVPAAACGVASAIPLPTKC